MTRQLRDSVQRGDTAGVVALVVSRDQVLYAEGTGKLKVAENKPMTTDAIFSIASMTKPVTSVAMMMLVERSKVHLDGPISKYLPSARILSPESVRMMGENSIGSIFVEVQTTPDKDFANSFPLGAGRDEFGLGFQIAAGNPEYKLFRSRGSLSWAGAFNTEFWIDPARRIGVVQMMHLLPFYDEGAIRTLRSFEETLYRNLQ